MRVLKKTILTSTVAFALMLLICGCGSSATNTIKGWEPADKQSEAAISVLGGTGEYAGNPHVWFLGGVYFNCYTN